MTITNAIMANPAPLLSVIKFSKKRATISTRPDAWGLATVVSCGSDLEIVISGANHACDLAVAIGIAHMHNVDLDLARLSTLAWSNEEKNFSL